MAGFYYYIKKGGLAVGDAGRSATKRTGSFASMGTSAYYDNIYDVFRGGVPTTAPALGDVAIVSHLHDHDYSASIFIGVASGVALYSVDDANADQYLRGAKETALGAGLPLRVFDGVTPNTIEGVHFLTGTGDLQCLGNYFNTLRDCELRTGFESMDGEWGAFQRLIDVDIIATHASFLGIGTPNGGGELTMVGGSFSDGLGGSIAAAFERQQSSYTLKATGVHINADALFTGGAEGVCNAHIHRCELAPGMVTSNSSVRGCYRSEGVIFQSCDVGDGYHYFKHERMYGVIDEETGIYRTAGATYDGANHFSAEMVSESTATHIQPLEFELFNGYIDTADFTTTVTAKVHFATNDATMAVDSSKVWFDFEYADGADTALAVVVTNRADPLDTGAAPTTETALWTGLDGTDQQKSMTIAATIGTTAGTMASGVVRVRMFLAGASDTIFVCPQVEFS